MRTVVVLLLALVSLPALAWTYSDCPGGQASGWVIQGGYYHPTTASGVCAAKASALGGSGAAVSASTVWGQPCRANLAGMTSAQMGTAMKCGTWAADADPGSNYSFWWDGGVLGPMVEPTDPTEDPTHPENPIVVCNGTCTVTHTITPLPTLTAIKVDDYMQLFAAFLLSAVVILGAKALYKRFRVDYEH